MKKTLLTLALTAAFFSTNAQTNISFEASEGFTLGPIENQNGWVPAFGADSDISTLSVSNLRASSGTYALQFTSNSEEWGYYDGVLSPNIPSLGNVFEIGFDIYPESAVDSDHVIYALQSADLNFAAYLVFNYQGNILARTGTGTPAVDVGDYTANQWYNVRISFNYTTSTLTYYINGNQVHTGPTMGTTTGVDQLLFAYDNYGSGFTIDNVQVATSLSTDKFNTNTLSVFPNPSNGIVNISNAENALLNNVAVMDINGRTVKNIQLSDVLEAQINISDLSAGVYMMNISSDQGTITKKIVKN
ncbi:T9SS type A sorting domain-containing protein [Flavobacterium sp. NST-5]|uniref:T9SS type A sorting domain-containing protein n=1 Tax=Flavobacterium ichthyis TaxID=2698827 RepID=A0ABW9Z5R0_9FLAO|nr:T9SS type A sorting domain-containing protein [Flavobacterium ichthyis]NBL64191.1 T9SS type A sorting domain-containing protein [Flavobacterium ichthyis]